MRRLIIPLFVAVLGAGGCSEKQKEAEFKLFPASPVVGVPFQVVDAKNIYFVDQDIKTDSDGNGNPDDDPDIGASGYGFYLQAGLYFVRGQDPRNDVKSLDKLVAVRPHEKIEDLADALPPGATEIPAADWQAYLFPNLSVGTQQQILAFENNSALTLGTIVKRAVGENGLTYLIELADPTSLVGVTDTNGNGTLDYAPRLALPPESLKEVVEQGYLPQEQQQGWNTILNSQPANLIVDPVPEGLLPLSNGTVVADYVFAWLHNGFQKTMGVWYPSVRQAEDRAVIAAYEAANPGYRNPSAEVIPEGPAWKIRKAMKEAIDVHNSN